MRIAGLLRFTLLMFKIPKPPETEPALRTRLELACFVGQLQKGGAMTGKQMDEALDWLQTAEDAELAALFTTPTATVPTEAKEPARCPD